MASCFRHVVLARASCSKLGYKRDGSIRGSRAGCRWCFRGYLLMACHMVLAGASCSIKVIRQGGYLLMSYHMVLARASCSIKLIGVWCN